MQWDIRLCGQFIRELAYIVNGDNPENRISIFQVNVSNNFVNVLLRTTLHSDFSNILRLHAQTSRSTGYTGED